MNRTSLCLLAPGLSLLLAAYAVGPTPASETAPERIMADHGISIDYHPGPGPVLVFIHGWACSKEHWKEQIPHFRGKHPMVALDLAGHGGTRVKKEKEKWTVPGEADEVVTVADALGLREMILVGHSMGGTVALEAASRMKGRVLGVIGVDCLQNADFKVPEAMLEGMAKTMRDDIDGFIDRFVRSSFPTGGPHEEMGEFVVKTMKEADREAIVALMGSFPRLDFPKLFKAAGTPIRCINADKPYDTVIETNRKYADYDAIVMPDVTHFVMLEKPAEFNRHLEKTIQGLLSRKK